MISEFHFIRPAWLLALLAVVMLVIALMHKKRSQSNWLGIIDPQLMPFVLRGKPLQKKTWPIFLAAIIGVLTVLALAGPTWKRLPTPVFQNQAALVIALDLSLSMESQDLKPSRIARARHKISDILKHRQEGQTALVAYAAQAFTVTPLTQDTETILLQVQDLSSGIMPAQGSRPDIALRKALSLFKQSHIRNGEVLLITDGIESGNMDIAIQQLKQAGHRLLILGVGTPEGAPITKPGGGFVTDASGAIVIPKLNETELKTYAHKGNGLYHRITANDQDINILLKTKELIDASIDSSEIKTDTWEDAGFWLILLIIPLILPAFRKGVLSVLLLLSFIPNPNTAYALDWDALWLNKNQQAKQAFIKEQHEQAATQFSEPNWKAAAQYRAGQYQQAIDTLKDIDTAEALYNKGNAQAKLGQLKEAIQSYEQALELDAEHEDAKYNRDLLKKMQEQQQNQENNNQENQENQKQDQQDQNQKNQNQENTEQEKDRQQQNNSGQENSEQKNQDQNQENTEQEKEKDRQQQNQTQKENEEQQQAQQKSENEKTEENQDANEQQQAQIEQLSEEQQATEQWIRRIPDDPGGLLRRKFKYQYKQQEHKSEKQKW